MRRTWLSMLLVGCGMTPPVPVPSRVAKLELECPRHSVMAYDASRTIVSGAALPCTARVFDSANAPLEGVELHFLAEAGRLIGTKSNGEGLIEVTHEVSLPLPLDVAPVTVPTAPLSDATHTGQPVAPTWMRPGTWASVPIALQPGGLMRNEPRRPDPLRVTPMGRAVNNPRDNLVTLVAWAEGAETFIDLNGNGAFDPTEPFDDLTEPFVDANDDGTRNDGEFFVDLNGSREWNGKNGVWDAVTKIWVQERVLWTATIAPEDGQNVVPGVVNQLPTFRAFAPDLSCPPLTSTQCASALMNNVPGVVRFYLSDPWFNTMARVGTGNGCVAESDDFRALVTYGPVSTNVDGTADSPDGLVGTVTVTDVRDPNSPATNRPRSNPQPYYGRLICRFSDGSPQGSQGYFIQFSGTIE